MAKQKIKASENSRPLKKFAHLTSITIIIVIIHIAMRNIAAAFMVLLLLPAYTPALEE